MSSATASPITIIIPGLGASGGPRTLIEWANRLAADSHDDGVVSPIDGAGSYLVSPEVEVRLPRPTTAFAGETVAKIGRRLRRRAADLRLYPEMVRSLIPKSGRVILGFSPWLRHMDVTDRWTVYCQHWEPVWFAGNRRATRLAEEGMAWSGPTIVNSSWLLSRMPAATAPALVFPGVDVDAFVTATPAVRSRDRPMLVALGREEVAWKGTKDLLNAMPLIGRPVDLMLYGTRQASTTQTEWGSVTRVGMLRQQPLADLVTAADAVICPSWYESFPLPPLEAMAAGTPVVTTGPGTEDYAVDGVNALVVEPHQPASIAAAVIRTLDDKSLAADMVTCGRQTAGRFTWEAGYAMFRRALELTSRS